MSRHGLSMFLVSVKNLQNVLLWLLFTQSKDKERSAQLHAMQQSKQTRLPGS